MDIYSIQGEYLIAPQRPNTGSLCKMLLQFFPLLSFLLWSGKTSASNPLPTIDLGYKIQQAIAYNVCFLSPMPLRTDIMEDKTPLTNQLVSRPILQLHQHPLRAGTDGGSALFRARAPADESHCRPDRCCGRNLSSGVSCVVSLRTGAAERED